MEPKRGLSTHKSSKMTNDIKGIVIGAVAAVIACTLAFLNERKYYLADAGYGDRKGFMSPYMCIRYHLKEYTTNPPENERELFNLRHSSLRMVMERAFGVLKKRFSVLDAEPFWPYETQVDVVLACCVLHNYLRGVDPNDPITREVEVEMASQDLQHMGEVIKEEKKANFRWSKDMSKELLDFLAEEVKKGNRPNNTFRTSSFVTAAKIISEKFQTNCTSEHVENRMKTVRNAWVAISTEYPKYEKFLNRKIDMYEEMAIVVGKDLARGNFSKTFANIDVDASMESGQPSMTNDSVPSKRVVPRWAQGHIKRGLELTKDRK
uniref:DDE Tnp4 domain-containing protein n=1 Tax=Chenopodium quinoa TaxID=63459 RepID=A0A803MJL9_CHEQI